MKTFEQKAEEIALTFTRGLGSIWSLIVHTILFMLSFSLVLFGIPFEKVLLVLTTILSLEAIYLAIFIQMSVNKNTAQIAAVEKDIDEIQEDVEELTEDVGEIQHDVEELAEDVGEIAEDVEELTEDVGEIAEDVDEIQHDVEELAEDVGEIAEDVEELTEDEEKTSSEKSK